MLRLLAVFSAAGPPHIFSFFLTVHFLDTCNVTIHPEAPAVEFGGSVNLNCTTTCANYTQLDWEVSVGGGMQKGDGWISLNITNVSEWELQPICIVQRKGFDSLDTNVVIYVYREYAQNFTAGRHLEVIVHMLLDMVCCITWL
uniref:Intercellular adhesion molecule N-terminal domain-containing protein n=1 Tax=Podarcis muralis TaxID=64176 RepID=A0A670KKF6_PODMU